MLTTAIVSSKTDVGSPLEKSLRQTGLVASVRHWTPDRWPSTATAISDVVILDLSHCAEACLALTARLRELQPKVLLIGWAPSGPPNTDLLLDAMRCGVQDVLSTPIDSGRLKELLSHAVQLAEPGNEPRESKLIVVMGVKGGSGATTVAVNLGVQLAKLTQKRVALLDFACPLGHVSLFLDLQPHFSIRDSVENLERMDEHLLSGLLTPHKSGLLVLAGASHPDDWRHVPPSALAQVVTVAQSSCDFVLVDLNSPYSPGLSSIVKQAHTVIMVAGVDVPNLSNVERHVAALTSLGVDPERLRVVINRWHLRDDELLARFLEKTKCSILARLPNDFPQVNQAITLGVPVSKNHGDPLGTRFRELARQLAGSAPVSEQKDTRGKLFYMLRASTARIGVPWHRVSET